MLIGLLHLRFNGGGMLRLGSLLWKQVRGRQLFVHVMISIRFHTPFGRVSFGYRLPPSQGSRQQYVELVFSSSCQPYSFYIQVLISLNLNGEPLSLKSLDWYRWLNPILLKTLDMLSIVRSC